MYFNVNFNVLKQNYCALFGLIKDWRVYKCFNSVFFYDVLNDAVCI